MTTLRAMVHVVVLVVVHLGLFLAIGAVLLSAWVGWLFVIGDLPPAGTEGQGKVSTEFPGDRKESGPARWT